MTHTPEPWVVRGRYAQPLNARLVCVVPHDDDPDKDRFIWAHAHRESTEDDANRIVACVNACEGINPEAVQAAVEACELALNWFSWGTNPLAVTRKAHAQADEVRRVLYAAIAKAEGREP